MSDWEIEIARNINKDDIIPIHNIFYKYCKKYKYYEYDAEGEFKYYHNYRGEFDMNEECFLCYSKFKCLRSLANSNFIIPSLYYKCFSIKNLKLTTNEHMHILAPLQNKIYCVFIKIKKLIDCRYLDLKSNKFVNENIKEKFDLLCVDYFDLIRLIVNLLFFKIKTRLKYLTLDDFLKIINNLRHEFIESPSKLVKLEYELAYHINAG